MDRSVCRRFRSMTSSGLVESANLYWRPPGGTRRSSIPLRGGTAASARSARRSLRFPAARAPLVMPGDDDVAEAALMRGRARLQVNTGVDLALALFVLGASWLGVRGPLGV